MFFFGLIWGVQLLLSDTIMLYFLCLLICWQLQRRWQWRGKKRSARSETCYHFALYKFQADFYGFECEPSRWEAGDVNDVVSTTVCCGYEPHCAYRSFVNIRDIYVRVCLYVCTSLHPSMALQPVPGLGLPLKTPLCILICSFTPPSFYAQQLSSISPNHIRPSSSWSSHWLCMYVRIHVYTWYRILQILSFALYMSNRRHSRSVSHLLFSGFVAYESIM